MDRIIFHIDVNNAFLSWSAISLLKDGYKKDIRKIPAVIGGDEKKRTGVVLAKSNPAKKYGVKTGEPFYMARRKCPNLEIYPPYFSWYQEKSRELIKYLEKYTPNIEQFSVDEAFLDMSGTNFLYKDYISLAHKIKDEIKELFGYTVNIGIGNNKLCAKMASDFEKPDKVHTLFKDEIETKMWPLEIEDLFMCGKKTSKRLRDLGINTIGDLANTDIYFLRRHFKNQGDFLYNFANGIDDSKVISKDERTVKNESISITRTLPYDYDDEEKLKEVLFRQAEEISRELRYKKKHASTVAIILKNNLFNTYSHQKKLNSSTNKLSDIYNSACILFDNIYKGDKIRLIGIRVSDLSVRVGKQLSIYSSNDDAIDKMQEVMDKINNKYGNRSVVPASIIKNKKTKK